MITDILIESDDEKRKPSTSLSNYQELFRRKTSLGMTINPLDIAKERLLEMSLWLNDQNTYITQLVDKVHSIEKQDLIKKINQYHHLAIQSLSHREKLHKLVSNYTLNFASIQCKIIAALNLAKFNGKLPIIDEKNFMIKKTSDYFEVHYHLRITELEIPNILPLLNLYEDENTGDLWMFFPRYSQTLSDINCTVDMLFEICFDIAYTLVYLHLHEIVHGNIHIKNISFDEHDQCYLANFYSNQIKTSDDILAFGQLGKFLYERVIESNFNLSDDDLQSINDFKILFIKCLSSNVDSRPKAVVIVQKLKEMRKNL